jgi:hypothetical protein
MFLVQHPLPAPRSLLLRSCPFPAGTFSVPDWFSHTVIKVPQHVQCSTCTCCVQQTRFATHHDRVVHVVVCAARHIQRRASREIFPYNSLIITIKLSYNTKKKDNLRVLVTGICYSSLTTILSMISAAILVISRRPRRSRCHHRCRHCCPCERPIWRLHVPPASLGSPSPRFPYQSHQSQNQRLPCF